MDRPDDDQAATPPDPGVQGGFPTVLPGFLPSVSFMITLAQKDRLRQLGYDETAISAMTPQDAHRILRLP
jgi:hypothetical protein